MNTELIRFVISLICCPWAGLSPYKSRHSMREKWSLRDITFWIVAALSILAVACAEPSPPAPSRFADYVPFDLRTRPDFSDYQQVVGSYLREQAPSKNAYACVIGLTQGDRSDDVVWIIWREGDRLIRWFPGENDLELSPRNLSLTDDIVPTDADIGSSTYLESRTWVTELERLCEDHGYRVSATK